MRWKVYLYGTHQAERSEVIDADDFHLDNGAVVFTRTFGFGGATRVAVAAFSEGAWDYIKEVLPEEQP